MDPSRPGHALRDITQDNEDLTAGHRRLLQSPSLQSLRSFISPKRVSAASRDMLAISQPVLAEGSREKMRNKIRQSPSMLSIHAKGAELASRYDEQQLDELLRHSSHGAPEPEFTPRSDRSYEHFSLARTPALELTQTLKIHDQLSHLDSFARILDVHLVPLSAGAAGDQCECLFEMPSLGERLSKVSFRSKHEPVQVLFAVAEALAAAEACAEFEHRNLHAGNIMIDRDLADGELRKVTILGCVLSRARQPGGTVLYTALDHPGFYEARLPVLSMMRKIVKNPAEYTPATNVLWLAYLARYMYNLKPSSRLRSLCELLHPKWPFRRSMRSAQEALARMRARTTVNSR